MARRRATRRRAAPTRRRRPKFGQKLGWPARALAAGVGFAIAAAPQLEDRPLGDAVPLTAGALLGAAVLLKFGRGNDLLTFVGLGMVIGGGAGAVIQNQLSAAVPALQIPEAA